MKKIIKQSLTAPLKGEFAPVLVNFIGTCNEDGSPHFCSASWVSFTLGPPKCIVFSTFVKPTIVNIMRTGEIAINMGTGEMAELSDIIYSIQELKKSDKPIHYYGWAIIIILGEKYCKAKKIYTNKIFCKMIKNVHF